MACLFTSRKEIYPGSKLKHFQALHKKTGIPYDEMVGPPARELWIDDLATEGTDTIGLRPVL
jgi:hypothetical protein